MQVYLIRIDYSRNLDDYQTLYPLLNKETKQKISRLLKKNDKICSLLSHIFLKHLISRELCCDLTDVEFAYEKYGKPYLLSNKGLSFNISHSGEFIAIALSNENVGIDIQEYIDLDYEELAMRFFASQEYNYISNASNIKENFFRIWTLKESYLKAIGSGLQSSLNSFYFSFKNNKIYLCHEGNNKLFYFHSESIYDNYHMSICSTKQIKDFEIHEYNQVELDALLLGGNSN